MTDRLIAIGDIHGDIVKLNTLLDKLNLSQKDTVVFLGDYIDVGNNSMEVIDKLILLSKTMSLHILASTPVVINLLVTAITGYVLSSSIKLSSVYLNELSTICRSKGVYNLYIFFLVPTPIYLTSIFLKLSYFNPFLFNSLIKLLSLFLKNESNEGRKRPS